MKSEIANFIKVFKTPFPYLVLFCGLTLSTSLLTWDEFRDRLYSASAIIDEPKCALCHEKSDSDFYEEGERFEFGIYVYRSPTIGETLINSIYFLLFLAFSPALLGAGTTMQSIGSTFPDIDLSTLRIIAPIAFIYFCANQLLMFSYLCFRVHDWHPSKPSKIQTIFSNS